MKYILKFNIMWWQSWTFSSHLVIQKILLLLLLLLFLLLLFFFWRTKWLLNVHLCNHKTLHFKLYHMWPWTSHNGTFLEMEIYTSSEIWINKLCIDVWFVRIGIWPRYNCLKIWNLRVQNNLNIEKIAFKVVQMKFLTMQITNQKFSFNILTVGNVQNIFMKNDLYLIS